MNPTIRPKIQVAVVQQHPLVSIITIKFTDGGILSIPHRDLCLKENEALDKWIDGQLASNAKYFLRSHIPPVDIPLCLSAYLFTHAATPKATYRPAPPVVPQRLKRLIRI